MVGRVPQRAGEASGGGFQLVAFELLPGHQHMGGRRTAADSLRGAGVSLLLQLGKKVGINLPAGHHAEDVLVSQGRQVSRR
jgi:hypothetical protein